MDDIFSTADNCSFDVSYGIPRLNELSNNFKSDSHFFFVKKNRIKEI